MLQHPADLKGNTTSKTVVHLPMMLTTGSIRMASLMHAARYLR